MLEYGQIVKIRNRLVVGRRYGPLVYTEHHAKFCGKLMIVYKISSNGTYYCAEGDNRYTVTFSAEMLELPKFKIGDCVKIVATTSITMPPMTTQMLSNAGKTAHIENIFLRQNHYAYRLDIDPFNVYPTEALYDDDLDVEDIVKEAVDKRLEDLQPILKKPVLRDENRLQKQETRISIGEGVKGSRVHGWHSKASIRSRPLRNPKSVRGK